MRKRKQKEVLISLWQNNINILCLCIYLHLSFFLIRSYCTYHLLTCVCVCVCVCVYTHTSLYRVGTSKSWHVLLPHYLNACSIKYCMDVGFLQFSISRRDISECHSWEPWSTTLLRVRELWSSFSRPPKTCKHLFKQ